MSATAPVGDACGTPLSYVAHVGAKYVIEGSVRKSGDMVRVTVQLIDATTGHHVWAERYDRRIDDIFALQDEITQRIAATVAPELERAERQRSIAKQPSDLHAWDFFLRGMSQLYEFSKEGNQRARELFERTVAIDPTYSRGHTGIAYSHYRDVMFVFADNDAHSIAKCLELAQRAVALDETDAFAHFVLSRADPRPSASTRRGGPALPAPGVRHGGERVRRYRALQLPARRA